MPEDIRMDTTEPYGDPRVTVTFRSNYGPVIAQWNPRRRHDPWVVESIPMEVSRETQGRSPEWVMFNNGNRWTANWTPQPTPSEPGSINHYRAENSDLRRSNHDNRATIADLQRKLAEARLRATRAEEALEEAKTKLTTFERLRETALIWRDSSKADRAKLKAFKNFCAALDSLPAADPDDSDRTR
jgi:hypothetical protein